MPEATCHCGAVRIVVPAKPEFIVDCNCSICRRNGALWAYYDPDAVELHGHPENTTAYVWGERSIRTVHCRTCGCITHWEMIDSTAEKRMGINTRNFEPREMQGIRIRRFDGAVTWSYID